jgi:UDP-glucose 4-epimerase
MGNTCHIIVTGGAGFIGSHIASRLISEGYKVTVLDNLSTGKEANVPQGADLIKIDLGQETSYDYLKNITCDAVFHLAGQSSGEASFKDPFYDLRSHVMSTFCLLDWCKKNGIPRFLYSSSMSIYGDPSYLPIDENHPLQPKTFYAAAKISAESHVKLYQTLGINTTIFRLFSVYGQGQNLANKMQGIVSIYLSYMFENTPIIVKGSKDRFRDFIYIDDVVEAWMISFDNPITYGKVYNVGSGKKTKVEDLLSILKNLFGNQDYPVEYRDGTPGDQFGVVADIKQITRDLKWSPKVDLQEGLKKMIDFEKGKLLGLP